MKLLPQEMEKQQVKDFLQYYAPDFVQEADIEELLLDEDLRIYLEEGMHLVTATAPGSPDSAVVPEGGNTLWNVLNPVTPVRLSANGLTRRLRSRYAVKAVAVVGALVLTSAVLFLVAKPGKHAKPVPLAAGPGERPEVMPGSSKATLLLQDGSSVELGSAGNGVIARQGATQLVKQAGGELHYTPSGAGTNSGFNTMIIPRGGQYKLQLPDGSRVWLNADSKLRYPTQFTGSERRVELTGEAYFEVAEDKNKPFRVWVQPADGRTPPALIEVLGTSFNVSAYCNTPLKTTLVTGAVKVGDGTETVVLKAGQSLEENSHPVIRKNNSAAVEEVIAWKNGLFNFHNASLKEVLDQIGRWYNLDVQYSSAISDSFNGSISRDEPLSHLLKLLEQTNHVRFTIKGNTISAEPL